MSSRLCLIFAFVLVALINAALASSLEDQAVSEKGSFGSLRVVREAKKKKKASRSSKGKGNKRKSRKRGKKGIKRQGNRRPSRNGKKRSKASVRAVDAKCIAQLTLAMRRWKDVVTNYKRQSARITDNKKKGGNKSGKKGLFAPIANKLVNFGGGNKSALECAGDSSGNEKLTALAKDLFDCEKSINASCNPANFPKPDKTLIAECDPKIEKFEKEADKCMKLSKDEDKATDGCACWTSDDMMKLTEDVNDCKVTDSMKAIKEQLKSCTTAFGDCRKLEDSAVEILCECAPPPPMGVQPIEITVAPIELSSAGASAGMRLGSRLAKNI